MMNTTQSSWRKHKSIPITLSEPLEHSQLYITNYMLIIEEVLTHTARRIYKFLIIRFSDQFLFITPNTIDFHYTEVA